MTVHLEPIRSELFSLERFDQHARSLAEAQTVTTNPAGGAKLTPRLEENSQVLRDSYSYITNALEQNRTITPAAEWLIDSFYIVEEQLREIKSHLPPGFYNQLPKLSSGFLKGYPRVYGLTWAYVAHTDSRFDSEVLTQFVQSYQTVQPLTSGELWAIAITLRVVMIENLRRLAAMIVTYQEAREAADSLADDLLGLTDTSPHAAHATLEDMTHRAIHPAFLVQLIQRFRYQDPATIPAVKWLNERVASHQKSADDLVTDVHRIQAASNLTVRNIITSFRSMNSFDWPEFFENVSLVQKVLLKYPDFAKMDFVTRDSYRHAVEDLSRRSGKDELEVATLAVQKNEDPGYFLVAKGRRQFEKELGYRISSSQTLVRFFTDRPTTFYVGGVFLLTLLIVLIPILLSSDALGTSLGSVALWVLIALAIIPASELAVAFLNRLVTELIGPKHLPRLKLADGPTSDMRTFVVVPTLLGRDEGVIASQFEQMEVHYLSNSEGEVRFALLTDWSDSSVEVNDADKQCLEFAVKELAKINERHGVCADGGNRFFLFHRHRKWNPSEGKWIGWERKRGKIHEFNQLLRGSRETSYMNLGSANSAVPSHVRYVITLDADTKLPKGAVNQLVGTLAHRLNQAKIDPQLNRVVEGYGVLQPRVTASLPARGESSIFQRLFSGECGIDPYASAVSDVYQDLFGEGSYTGKGIYDVDTFETTLRGRIPENALLSHDLFEGSFARSGFVSDIEFFEDFPSHSEVSSARNHRWVRGDWQLLPWIFGRGGKSLSLISRWKMIDNLRRSLLSVSVFLLLIAAYCMPAGTRRAWVYLAYFSIGIPPFISFAMDFLPRGRATSLRDHLRDIGKDFVLGLGHFLVSFVLLAQHAWLYTDAIFRALWRLFISKKHLLEWLTAAQAKSSSSLSLASFIRRLKGSVVLALVGGVLIFVLNDSALLAALPILVLWFFAPFFARQISLPPLLDEVVPLSSEELFQLRLHARKIWRFFTTFVTAEDHFLPPDNFQEDPHPVVAHRSSPTNFGLYLLSTVSAHDFGWCGLNEMTERLHATLDSMMKLPRFRGHFFNWYETKDFRVLEPRYISAVDSGNLAGHLLTLAKACDDLGDAPVFPQSAIVGIQDGVALLKRAVDRLGDDQTASTVPLDQLKDGIAKLEEWLNHPPQLAANRQEYWYSLGLRSETLRDIANAFALDRVGPGKTNSTASEVGDVGEVVAWATLVASNIKSHVKDFEKLIPWSHFLSNSMKVAESSTEEKKLWESIQELLSLEIRLSEIPSRGIQAIEHLESLRVISKASTTSIKNDLYLDYFIDAIQRSSKAAVEMRQKFQEISSTARKLFDEMEFGFLLNKKKRLFSIGYRVAEDELDESCYDLLASEARLTSYVAIIKGDVPVSHWFRLGRALTPVENGAALVSWSGSMFEYLMPSLVMFTPRGSLLDQTCRLIVRKQIQYGNLRRVPWGISESAYNIRDLELTYQYSNFGVPGLGLKRGLGSDLVIAPYATALASMYDPHAAVLNLKAITAEGGQGAYGFYESMDYTPSRLRENQQAAIVKAYMAHHQGMALLSFANVIHQGLMRRRFHSEPLVQAGELLLQERTPRNVGSVQPRTEDTESRNVRDSVAPVIRRLTSPHHPIPSSHLLSNGRYSTMVTAAGSGYSKWKNLSITRWKEDVTRDNSGSYIYLRDMKNGAVWSATYQPTLIEAESSEMVFSEDRAKIARHDLFISSNLEVIVSPEDDAELRRLSLTNTGKEVREIEVTSYLEAVLAPADADRAHPAFSNLFVQTEFVPEAATLLATRRLRSSKDTKSFMAQVISVDSNSFGGIEYETDRARFIGRARTLVRPAAITDGRPLSNTTGSVLDPVMSLRARVRIQPGATAHVCFTTLATNTRDEAIALGEKYHNPAAFERSSTLAWTQAQVRLHYLGIDSDEAQVFQKLANRVIYSDPMMRPASEILKRNQKDVTGLWARGISGDLPIILVRIDDSEDQPLIRQILRAHEYWRAKRLSVDVIILNEKATSYVQDLQLSLEGMVRGTQSSSPEQQAELPGKIFVLRNDLLSREEKELLLSVSRAILDSRQGNLSEQVMKMRKLESLKELPVTLLRDTIQKTELDRRLTTNTPNLQFFNGIGGFSQNGREYVISLGKGQRTPAPWVNVISNSQFGFHVSESGSGYTWSLNSRENQITSWTNDPVVDPPSEALYISEISEESIWTPTATLIRLENSVYNVRHGTGYSVFETTANGINSELTQFVSWKDSIKISKLVLKNISDRTRELAITGYVEWVLGFSRSQTAHSIITEMDATTGAMFAYNPLSTEFGRRISFIDFRGEQKSFTADRSEFLGRNGTPAKPAALLREGDLGEAVGAGLDPCGALQTTIVLKPGESKEVFFFLGQADTRESARHLIHAYRRIDLNRELEGVVQKWDGILNKVQVETPDRSMDLMLNTWLLYQTLVCRFWARAAFYQAGGAYGFRDQLQDVMAIVVGDRDLARSHILRASARQFIEGDVQHWWHPPTGRGVRTHFSDDLLWLPYVVLHYLEVTHDQSLLEEAVPFIEGPILRPDQEDSYFEPRVSMEMSASIYEHCARTLDRSQAVGVHGLPLMGSGDWNDGMNRVGNEGKGESVWVAWFMIPILKKFAKIALARGEEARATQWTEHAEKLRNAIETEAWDGAWYRRAYFDDGTPLGSGLNVECRIDSIAQTWAVLSEAGDPARAQQAMAAVEAHLVRSQDELVLLFTPPFDHTPMDPGYIKGYLPGVRENGGQYTHAAVWCICAYAGLGRGDRATELFSMLNPINHASTRTGVQTYKVEPYVMAADIYGVHPHTGRGGWTWYTGSSGWMYRAGLEYILGFHLRGNFLKMKPCIPAEWNNFKLTYRHGRDGATTYEVQVENPQHVSEGVVRIELDGLVCSEDGVPLTDDLKTHQVKVVLG